VQQLRDSELRCDGTFANAANIIFHLNHPNIHQLFIKYFNAPLEDN
jgi:hypothetical protein